MLHRNFKIQSTSVLNPNMGVSGYIKHSPGVYDDGRVPIESASECSGILLENVDIGAGSHVKKTFDEFI